ncbi:hypothetical protein A3Q56_03204 [Intoshia linei]|uniref:E3 ubiquitin-protein ligase n=1 Tax=Intoshia linei TaxID=1819745 RepID=A0A177B456_9BILA|nr:hypothetical protein A3Q56_03204 [Intoshia linei]
MTGADPSTLLEWLKTGNAELQLVALEQLCMMLLMSDNIDRCFDNYPPRTFLPALANIFLNESASDQLLEVTARAITYYLDVSSECSRRLVAIDSFIKSLCNRISNININERISKDLVEQCVKMLEYITIREISAILDSGALNYIITLISEYEQHLHKDTVQSAMSTITKLCQKLSPDEDKLAFIVSSLSSLLYLKSPEITDKTIKCFLCLSENFYRKHIDCEILASNGLIEFIIDRLGELVENENKSDNTVVKSNQIYPPPPVNFTLKEGIVSISSEDKPSTPKSFLPRVRSTSNVINMVPDIKKSLNSSLQLIIKLLYSLFRSSRNFCCRMLHIDKFVDIFELILYCQNEKVQSEVIKLAKIISGSLFYDAEHVKQLCNTIAPSHLFVERAIDINVGMPIIIGNEVKSHSKKSLLDCSYLKFLELIRSNNVDEIVNLIEKDANIGSNFDKIGLSLFSAACVYGTPEVVKLLINNKCLNLGMRAAPLHYAVRFGRYEIVKILLDSGANIDKKTISKEIAVNLIRKECLQSKNKTLRENYYKIAKLLLESKVKMNDDSNFDIMNSPEIIFQGYTDIADRYIYKLLPIFCELFRSSISQRKFPLQMIIEMLYFCDAIILADLELQDPNFSSNIIEILITGLQINDIGKSKLSILSIIESLCTCYPDVYLKGFSFRGIQESLLEMLYSSDVDMENAYKMTFFTVKPEPSTYNVTPLPKGMEWCYVKSLEEKTLYEFNNFAHIMIKNNAIFILTNLYAIDIPLFGNGNVLYQDLSSHVLIPSISNHSRLCTDSKWKDLLKVRNMEITKSVHFMHNLRASKTHRNLCKLLQSKKQKYIQSNQWTFIVDKPSNFNSTNSDKSLYIVHEGFNVKIEIVKFLNGFVHFSHNIRQTHVFYKCINFNVYDRGKSKSMSDFNISNYNLNEAVIPIKVFSKITVFYKMYDLYCNLFTEIKLENTPTLNTFLNLYQKIEQVFTSLDITTFNRGDKIEHKQMCVSVFTDIVEILSTFISILIDQSMPSSFEIQSSKIISKINQILLLLRECIIYLIESKEKVEFCEKYQLNGNSWQAQFQGIFTYIFNSLDSNLNDSNSNVANAYIERLVSYLDGIEHYQNYCYEASFVASLQNLTRQCYFKLFRHPDETTLVDRSETTIKIEPLTTVSFIYNHIKNIIKPHWYDKPRSTFAYLKSISNDPVPILFVHESDFDDNGIIYFIGTNSGLSNTFINPAKHNIVIVRHSGMHDSTVNSKTYEYLSRSKSPNIIRTADVINSWVSIDLGIFIKPTAYTLRHSVGTSLRNWEFQGSVDGKTWYNLRKHTDDTSLRSSGYSTYTWSIDIPKNSNYPKEYRYVRIFSTGPGSGGKNHFISFCGFEIYGSVCNPVFDMSDSALEFDKKVPSTDVTFTVQNHSLEPTTSKDTTSDNDLLVGDEVIRGPDWCWDDQDGNSTGSVVNVYKDKWICVKWNDNDYVNNYRYGYGFKYDVTLNKENIQDPTTSSSITSHSNSHKSNKKKFPIRKRHQIKHKPIHEDNRRKIMKSTGILKTTSNASCSTTISDASLPGRVEEASLTMIADMSDNQSSLATVSDNEAFYFTRMVPSMESRLESSISTGNAGVFSSVSNMRTGRTSSMGESFIDDNIHFDDRTYDSDGNSAQESSLFPEIISTITRGSRVENTRSLLNTFANIVRNPNFDSSQSRHLVRFALAQSRYLTPDITTIDFRTRDLAAPLKSTQGRNNSRRSVFVQFDDSTNDNYDSCSGGEVEDDADETADNVFNENSTDEDNVFSSVYQEFNEESSLGNLWVEDSILRREFKSLVPSFDPRPGRTIVNQSHTLVIPTNTLVTCSKQENNCGVPEADKKETKSQCDDNELEDIILYLETTSKFGNSAEMVLLENNDKTIFSQLQLLFNGRARKNCKKTNTDLIKSIWSGQYRLLYKSVDKTLMNEEDVEMSDSVLLPEWNVELVRNSLTNSELNSNGPTKADIIKFLQKNASQNLLTEYKLNGSPRVLRRSISSKDLIGIYDNYVRYESKNSDKSFPIKNGFSDDIMDILSLLTFTHHVLITNESNLTISEESFISRKLTQKLVKQIHEPLSLCCSALPSWCDRLIYEYPWLFNFEMRNTYLSAQGYDPSRSVVWLQNQRDEINLRARRFMQNSGLVRNDEVYQEFRLGRIKIDRVVVPRNEATLFEYGRRIMNYHCRLKSTLEILFENEDGTGTGPTLDFYNLLAVEFQKKSLVMWLYDPNNTSSYVHTEFGLFPMALKQDGPLCDKVVDNFYYFGILVGKTILDGRLLPVKLSNPFLQCICGAINQSFELNNYKNLFFSPNWFNKFLTLTSLKSIDPVRVEFVENLYSRLEEYNKLSSTLCECGSENEKILNDHIEYLKDLDLVFCVNPQCEEADFINYNLVAAGCEVTVNFENLKSYLDNFLNFYFNFGITRQMNALKAGMEQVFPMHKLKNFSVNELNQLISGQIVPSWTRQELYDYIEPKNGYTRESPMFKNLINVLMELDEEQRKKFLRFSTGCSSLPPGGFKSFNPRMIVVKNKNASDNRLPSVSTCIHFLKIPDYSSQEILKTKLLAAMDEKGFYLN